MPRSKRRSISPWLGLLARVLGATAQACRSRSDLPPFSELELIGRSWTWYRRALVQPSSVALLRRVPCCWPAAGAVARLLAIRLIRQLAARRAAGRPSRPRALEQRNLRTTGTGARPAWLSPRRRANALRIRPGRRRRSGRAAGCNPLAALAATRRRGLLSRPFRPPSAGQRRSPGGRTCSFRLGARAGPGVGRRLACRAHGAWPCPRCAAPTAPPAVCCRPAAYTEPLTDSSVRNRRGDENRFGRLSGIGKELAVRVAHRRAGRSGAWPTSRNRPWRRCPSPASRGCARSITRRR